MQPSVRRVDRRARHGEDVGRVREPGSNIEWRQWGERDPLFGVAPIAGKERGGAAPWSDPEFYDRGAVQLRQFMARWTKYGLDRRSCVEIGCGVGRMTQGLVTEFAHVHALDVAEGMLAYARRHVNAGNVTFHATDGRSIPLPDASVTAAFSANVFQHFDTQRHATRYFAEIARVLQPGGSLLVHVVLHQWPVAPGVAERFYRAYNAAAGLVAGVRRRLSIVGLGRPIMRGLSYSAGYFFDALPPLGFEDVELWLYAWGSARRPVACVLARRATSS